MSDWTPSGTLEVGGCSIAFRLTGEGPRVVLIQGTAVHGEGWRPQVETLQGRYTCLTFDNRGMGRSLPAAGAISVEGMAADTLALLDHLGWNQAHVVGHSLGGQVALEVALRAPQRILTLALLSTFARGRDALAMTPAKVWCGLRSYVGTRRMRRRAMMEMVLPRRELEGRDLDDLALELEGLFGHDLAVHPPIEGAQLGALRRYDATGRLERLAGVPTLVVSGELDRIASPASGRALAQAIPGAQFVEIAGAGHALPIHDPQEVNGRLERLFATR